MWINQLFLPVTGGISFFKKSPVKNQIFATRISLFTFSPSWNWGNLIFKVHISNEHYLQCYRLNMILKKIHQEWLKHLLSNDATIKCLLRTDLLWSTSTSSTESDVDGLKLLVLQIMTTAKQLIRYYSCLLPVMFVLLDVKLSPFDVTQTVLQLRLTLLSSSNLSRVSVSEK